MQGQMMQPECKSLTSQKVFFFPHTGHGAACSTIPSLYTWLQSACRADNVVFIDHFNLFWGDFFLLRTDRVQEFNWKVESCCVLSSPCDWQFTCSPNQHQKWPLIKQLSQVASVINQYLKVGIEAPFLMWISNLPPLKMAPLSALAIANKSLALMIFFQVAYGLYVPDWRLAVLYGFFPSQ